MGENIWNGALEYLEKSRRAWWNNDYMEFLVEKVWKIDKPVSIIDFGCGIGFLGELLLPLLPNGSIYTGVDIADKLLDEAKKRFENTKYETHFIVSDLNDYIPEQKYDIAICQAVLQHIPDPTKILEKMKASVKANGMVICMELSRDVAGASMYIDGLDYSHLNLLGVEQKLRRNDLDRIGKDFEIGLKLPVYMEKMGLQNVDVKVNNYAQFISPMKQDYKYNLEAFMAGSWGNRLTKEDKEDFIKLMTDKGLTLKEAKHEFRGMLKIYDYLYENQEKLSIVNSNCMFISYGYNINPLNNVWNKVAKAYGSIGPEYWNYFGKKLVEYADIRTDAKVLDIGCGRGASLIPSVKKIGNKGSIIGIDSASEMVVETRKEVDTLGIKNISVLEMDAKSLDFDDESFDNIICGFGLPYIVAQDDKLTEIMRVLKTGGQVGFCSWKVQNDSKWLNELFKKYLDSPSQNHKQSSLSPSFDTTTQAGIKEILEGAGFKNINILSEDKAFIYKDEEEWLEEQWSNAVRMHLEKIEFEGEALYNSFKADAFEGLQKFKADDGFQFKRSVIYAYGTK